MLHGLSRVCMLSMILKMASFFFEARHFFYFRNGLNCFSAAMVVSGPWPG